MRVRPNSKSTLSLLSGEERRQFPHDRLNLRMCGALTFLGAQVVVGGVNGR